MEQPFSRKIAQNTVIYKMFESIILRQKPSQIKISLFNTRGLNFVRLEQNFDGNKKSDAWGKIKKYINSLEKNYEIIFYCNDLIFQFIFSFYELHVLRNSYLGKNIAHYELNIRNKEQNSFLTVESSGKGSVVCDYMKDNIISKLTLNGGAVLMEMLFDRNMKQYCNK